MNSLDMRIEILELFFEKDIRDVCVIDAMITHHQEKYIELFFQLLKSVMDQTNICKYTDLYNNTSLVMYAAINSNDMRTISRILDLFPEFKEHATESHINFPGYAVNHRKNEALKYMLNSGVSPDSWDEAFICKAPIEYATDIDNLEAIVMLLSYGATKNVANAIINAMERQKIHLAKAIIANIKDDVINYIKDDLLECLSVAIKSNQMDVVMELFARGLDINEVDGKGNRPLDYAESRYTIANLKEMGAVCSTLEHHQIKALSGEADEISEQEAIERIASINHFEQVFMEGKCFDLPGRFARNGKLEVVKKIMESNIDSSVIDGKIYYDMFCSIQFQDDYKEGIANHLAELLSFSKYLIKRGVSVESREGASAIHALCDLPPNITLEEENKMIILQIMDYFVDQGCDINQGHFWSYEGDRGKREYPLILAIANDNLPCVQYLVSKNACIPKDRCSMSIIDALIYYRDVGSVQEANRKIIMIRELQKIGLDVREQDEDGRTYLHHICIMAAESNVNWLRLIPEILEYGANEEVKDVYGETPYECFHVWKSKECAAIIRKITRNYRDIEGFLDEICIRLEKDGCALSYGELTVFLKIMNAMREHLSEEEDMQYKELVYQIQKRVRRNLALETEEEQIALLKKMSQMWSKECAKEDVS